MYKFNPMFDTDYTGINKDNHVLDEPHELNIRVKNKAVVPNHGLFYAKSLIVRVGGENPLIRGKDYQVIESHEELTLKTGREVVAGLIIFEHVKATNVLINYQAVGGWYSTDNRAIANLYESVVNDTRKVPWDNILNKPAQYPPTAHYHILNDIVGFEPIVYQLERMRAGITLAETDLKLKLVNDLLNRHKVPSLRRVLPHDGLMQKDAMLYFMSRRKMLSKTWIDIADPNVHYGRNMLFMIDTSEYPVGTKFEWAFYKQDYAPIHLPVKLSGVVEGNGDIVYINSYIPAVHTHEPEVLYLGVKVSLSEKMFDGNHVPPYNPLKAKHVGYDPNKPHENGLYSSKLDKHPDYINKEPNRPIDEYPISETVKRRFADEFDAVTYRLGFIPLRTSNTIYADTAILKDVNDDMTNAAHFYMSSDKMSVFHLSKHISLVPELTF